MPKRLIIAVTGAVVGVAIAAVGVRWYVRAHTMPAAHPCVNNLAVIDGCKQQWALEKDKTTNDIPTWDDLRPYLGRETNAPIPVCPQGGTYTLGRIGEPPRCSLGERDPLYHALQH